MIARFDMAGFVTERVTDRFARSEGAAFVNGTGVGQPQGFMTVPTDTAADFTRDYKKIQHVVSGSGSAVTFDGLKSLYWTMRAPHRANAAWLMSVLLRPVRSIASKMDRVAISGVTLSRPICLPHSWDGLFTSRKTCPPLQVTPFQSRSRTGKLRMLSQRQAGRSLASRSFQFETKCSTFMAIVVLAEP